MRNKLLIGIPALTIIGILLLGNNSIAYAQSGTIREHIGFQDGASAARNDNSNSNGYNGGCPSGHTDSYCAGFEKGYDTQWNILNGHYTRVAQNNDQTLNSAVNIKGNNNRVTVNQDASNIMAADNNNNNGHSDNSGSSSGNPRCEILCLNLN